MRRKSRLKAAMMGWIRGLAGAKTGENGAPGAGQTGRGETSFERAVWLAGAQVHTHGLNLRIYGLSVALARSMVATPTVWRANSGGKVSDFWALRSWVGRPTEEEAERDIEVEARQVQEALFLCPDEAVEQDIETVRAIWREALEELVERSG